MEKFAAEIGGTFTDIIYLNYDNESTEIKTMKVAPTPSQPELAVIEGADKLVHGWKNMTDMLHGSTVATNAILERKGSVTALLVTDGFADMLEYQRGDKENVYDLFYQRRTPVIPRDMVYAVPERVAANGEILKPLDTDVVRKIAQELKEKNVQSVGICYLHSYMFVEHERLTKQLLEEYLPDAIVTASHEILPQFREYERGSTIAITAYIAPVMVKYIENLYAELKKREFDGEIFITQSNGGVIPMKALRQEVARTLLSGPAAGVTGAIFMAKQIGVDNIITLDIGGTSADVCLVNHGVPVVSNDNKIDGSAVAVPMLDIVTVGAGGGSITWLDNGGMLRVGPQSAGAVPGPACYDRGGKVPTVSDSLAYRGLLRPEHFAGGNYPLKVENSRVVIQKLADKMNCTSDQLAEAITDIMEANTMQALRVISTERGYDARQYMLVAYGGGGALHAANIAQELGITQVLIPCYAGILSSFGLLVADIIRDYVQTRLCSCDTTSTEDIATFFAGIEERAIRDMESYGFRKEQLQFSYALDARYTGQASELQVDVDGHSEAGADVAEKFHKVHLARYGCNSPENSVEIVNFRLKVVVPQDNEVLKKMRYNTEAVMQKPRHGTILVDGKWVDCSFYDWKSVCADAPVAGPAVIEDDTTTCYIPRGWTGRLQANGSMLLNYEEV